MSAYNFVRSGRNFTKIFCVQRRKNPSRQRRLDFVAIFIVSRDIRGQTRKLSLNVLDFRRFLPSQILRGAVPPIFVLALTPQPRDASTAKI